MSRSIQPTESGGAAAADSQESPGEQRRLREVLLRRAAGRGSGQDLGRRLEEEEAIWEQGEGAPTGGGDAGRLQAAASASSI